MSGLFSWAAIVGSLAKGFAYVTGLFYNKQQQDAGAAEQQAADRKATDQDEKAADDVKNTVAGTNDAGVDKLRDRWTVP